MDFNGQKPGDTVNCASVEKLVSRYQNRDLVAENDAVTNEAPVAQLDRVADFESEGCRFESCRARSYADLRSGVTATK